jgi:NADH-quinone oxidoreductase subunit F
MLLEGIIIASYAIGCHIAYIYIRGEFGNQAKLLNRTITQAHEKGFLGKDILGSGFDLDVVVHRGAGAYICGEETALLESLEGKRGYPRLKPPFPAVEGFMKSPTIVNNVETLANIPWIIENGGDAYAAIGTEKSTGTRLFSVSGHVNKPGVYELPHGITMRELVYDHCGGITDDRPIKAIIPGGSSVPVLDASAIDMKLDYESVAEAGSMLGSAAVIIMNDSICMVDAILRITEFYAHESCGQCTPCREGIPWMVRLLKKIEEGKGELADIDYLLEISTNITGRTICPLGDAAAMPVESFVKVFRSEFEDHVREKRCPSG